MKSRKMSRLSQNLNTPRRARNIPFTHLGAPRACQSTCASHRFIWPKLGIPGACLGKKTARERPAKNPKSYRTRNTSRLSQNLNTPTLARNAPFAHLGAPRACQSYCISDHTAKTRHSRHMFGRKTARKRPERDRIWFTATVWD